ncbi:MAG: hypothetical protein WC405_21135 [Syntrophales bacterium]
MKRILIIFFLLTSLQLAYGYTPEEIGRFQSRLTSIQTEINNLNTKLAGTSDEKTRKELTDKLQFYQLLADDLDRKIKEGSSATTTSTTTSTSTTLPAVETTTTVVPATTVTTTTLAAPIPPAFKKESQAGQAKVVKAVAVKQKAAVDVAKVKKEKQRLAALQTEIAKLNKRHARTKNASDKKAIAAKILNYKKEVAAIKSRLYPRPKINLALTPPPTFEAAAIKQSRLLTLEAEDFMYYPPAVKEVVPGAFKRSIGINGGFFGGATSLLGEFRLPLRMVFGPALTSLRVSAGLAQSRDAGTRYYPANVDLLFNFPPGWFTGTENYIGFGLNYVTATSMSKPGTIGGEVFYGVESEGFGGTVFGEVGYAILRTGFSPSHKGVTVLVGLRKVLG